MKTTKTILATAYAINPFKGSEDGMGWNFVCQIARFHKVIAITRVNNKPHIERYQLENPNPVYTNIRFLYFDLPYWMRFWKKGGRGAMLYFGMWQKGIVSFIRKQNIQYDIVHNVNFHNDWTPSFLWKLGKPFVWGPIGHHPLIPKQYLSPFSISYRVKDLLTWWVKKFFWKFSLNHKKTVQKADFILGMNSTVGEILNVNAAKFTIMPSVATDDFGFDEQLNNDDFIIISAGRLVPLKGFDLTINAFNLFASKLSATQLTKVKLVIVGSGPEELYFKNIASSANHLNNIQFINWIDRNDLMALFRKSSCFLFPSHEGAGMVVAEALSFGLPVICLDNCGPGEFISPECGIAIPENDYNTTVSQLAQALETLYLQPDKHKKMRLAARKRFEEYFDWHNRGEQLKLIYEQL